VPAKRPKSPSATEPPSEPPPTPVDGALLDGGSHGVGSSPAGPRRLRFPRKLRIVRHAEFDRVMQEGVRGGDGRIALWALASPTGVTRLGIVVGRRHGGAVRRNRLKRRLREAFRQIQATLPAGVDLVAAPRPGAEPTVAELRASLAALAERLAARLRKGAEGGD